MTKENKKDSILHQIIFLTRSYAALRAADLDWIIGSGYSPWQRKAKCLIKKNHCSLSCIPMREQKWVVLFFLQVRLWRCTLMENLLSGLSGYCRDLWLISGSRSSKPTENYFFVEESNLLLDMVSVGLDWGYITSCWVTNIWVTGCIVSSCVGTNMQLLRLTSCIGQLCVCEQTFLVDE